MANLTVTQACPLVFNCLLRKYETKKTEEKGTLRENITLHTAGLLDNV